MPSARSPNSDDMIAPGCTCGANGSSATSASVVSSSAATEAAFSRQVRETVALDRRALELDADLLQAGLDVVSTRAPTR